MKRLIGGLLLGALLLCTPGMAQAHGHGHGHRGGGYGPGPRYGYGYYRPPVARYYAPPVYAPYYPPAYPQAVYPQVYGYRGFNYASPGFSIGIGY